MPLCKIVFLIQIPDEKIPLSLLHRIFAVSVPLQLPAANPFTLNEIGKIVNLEKTGFAKFQQVS